jgi:hypothetical protein
MLPAMLRLVVVRATCSGSQRLRPLPHHQKLLPPQHLPPQSLLLLPAMLRLQHSLLPGHWQLPPLLLLHLAWPPPFALPSAMLRWTSPHC